MANEFIDLLGSLLGPTLSETETARLRVLRDQGRAADSTPWASGVPDTRSLAAARPRSEADALRERVVWLELSLKVVCDLLTDAGVLDRAALLQRLSSMKAQVDADVAERERSVVCAGCGAKVDRARAHFRATGVLCEACHAGPRARGPKLKEVRVASEGGYRDAPRTELVEESVSCAGCRAVVAVSKSYNSARGPLCVTCHLEDSDE